MTTTVLIADDHPIFRRGLRDILEETEHFRIVAEVDDGDEALTAMQEHLPDVAVLDISMPNTDGLDVLTQIQKWAERPAVVLLTMYDDYVEPAMRLGVDGYLLKENAEDELVACLEAVIRNERFVSRGIKWTSGSESDPVASIERLTPSERRILQLIAELKTSREIGELLYISHRTVQNHRTNMCNKLGLHGDKALLGFALKHKAVLSPLQCHEKKWGTARKK